jgi:hypothetical protein
MSRPHLFPLFVEICQIRGESICFWQFIHAHKGNCVTNYIRTFKSLKMQQLEKK